MKFLLVILAHVVFGQQTCGDASTFPCPVESNFPRPDIYRTYIVKGKKSTKIRKYQQLSSDNSR